MALIFISLLFVSSPNSTIAQSEKDSIEVLVDWEKNYATALEKAKVQDEVVFIYFWTDWCAPCQQLDEIVFSDAKLGPAINKYVSLKVNAEEGEGIKLRKKYNIGGYPNFLFLDKNGKEIGRIRGTRGNEEYLKLINNQGRAE